MARANSGATDSVRIFPQAAASGLSGIELVTTTSKIFDLRCVPLPDPTKRVGRAGGNARRPWLQQRFDAFHQRSGRIDQVVHNQTILSLEHRR